METKDVIVLDKCYNLLELDALGADCLVWIDAHADLHTEETTLTGFIGGMALRLVIEKFKPKEIHLYGVKEWEPGESENAERLGVCCDPHGWSGADLHLHIDCDVLEFSWFKLSDIVEVINYYGDSIKMLTLSNVPAELSINDLVGVRNG